MSKRTANQKHSANQRQTRTHSGIDVEMSGEDIDKLPLALPQRLQAIADVYQLDKYPFDTKQQFQVAFLHDLIALCKSHDLDSAVVANLINAVRDLLLQVPEGRISTTEQCFEAIARMLNLWRDTHNKPTDKSGPKISWSAYASILDDLVQSFVQHFELIRLSVLTIQAEEELLQKKTLCLPDAFPPLQDMITLEQFQKLELDKEAERIQGILQKQSNVDFLDGLGPEEVKTVVLDTIEQMIADRTANVHLFEQIQQQLGIPT